MSPGEWIALVSAIIAVPSAALAIRSIFFNKREKAKDKEDNAISKRPILSVAFIDKGQGTKTPDPSVTDIMVLPIQSDGISDDLYNKKILDTDNQAVIGLKLENLGETTISNIWYVCNVMQRVSICDTSYSSKFIEYDELNFIVMARSQFVPQKQSVTLNLRYLKTDHSGLPDIDIFMCDINGRNWHQRLEGYSLTLGNATPCAATDKDQYSDPMRLK